ncbi:DnaJ sub C member 5B [Cadophora gregata]|uniref:DnaJ sub C member 5B n=1 Tax=Cadophora gregata TaxID=51156 RepID=UPI0026DC12F7|nr:DnaJ sub C member 5B [Cadophora gregata]KAK0124579.1 DnaJ sub C member 5B [Cadophora gregata]KAK0129565.1 DnaJ sub C member 5B [Cadophora gregata f. sp. sojae]
MATFESHYEILGVERSASVKQITIAYRKLALKHHPDKNKEDPTATQRFQKISNAHDILKDDKARAHYDSNLSHLKAAWEAQQATEAKQQRRRQSKHSRKIAELERKKGLILKCIHLQNVELRRLRSLWDKLHSGEIPEGFEEFQLYGGDKQEVYMAIRGKLCELLHDLTKNKMEPANYILVELATALKRYQK